LCGRHQKHIQTWKDRRNWSAASSPKNIPPLTLDVTVCCDAHHLRFLSRSAAQNYDSYQNQAQDALHRQFHFTNCCAHLFALHEVVVWWGLYRSTFTIMYCIYLIKKKLIKRIKTHHRNGFQRLHSLKTKNEFDILVRRIF